MSSKFYTDPQFNTLEVYAPLPPIPVGPTTATAGTSTTVLNTNVYGTPVFARPTVVQNVRVTTITAPAVTPGTLGFLNGTSTLATIVVPAAGTTTASLVAANAASTFTAGGQMTVQYQGTASATTVAIGNYNVYFDASEQFN